MFLYFNILTRSPTSNYGSLSLSSTLKSMYVLEFILTGFILVVLWYAVLLINYEI